MMTLFKAAIVAGATMSAGTRWAKYFLTKGMHGTSWAGITPTSRVVAVLYTDRTIVIPAADRIITVR